MHILRCELTLLENTFFSSRELGNFYQTEPFIGNYALCYALGLAVAPYDNDGTIHYRQHLTLLNERGIYVTPATLAGQPRFAMEQFNSMPDSYWYAMGKNALITKPGRKGRTMNQPQIGRIKLLGIGNRAVFYVFSRDETPALHRYIRLGKWMSKARLEVEIVSYEMTEEARVSIPLLLNPVDLSPETGLESFDMLSVHPVPLLRNALLSGSFYRLQNGVHLPQAMSFGVEAMAAHD